jgi:hypothetical protein
MPDALAQRVGTSVTLALDGGWAITDVQAEVAANAEIQPSGRSPLAQAWVVTRAADGTFALAVPAPGDWGVKLLVSGERDGDRFQVPYYARVIVDGP